jgi:hypothetical protein
VKPRSSLVCVLLLTFAATLARADETTGVIRGKVLDDLHRSIAGASVQITSPSETQTVITNRNGDFIFFGVSSGHYRMIAYGVPGYALCQVPDFDVNAGETWHINLMVRGTCSPMPFMPVHLTQFTSAGYSSDVYIIH